MSLAGSLIICGSHKFKFDGIFDMKSTQDEVFTRVAKEACDKCAILGLQLSPCV